MNTGPLIAIAFIALVFALAALRTGLGYLNVHRDAAEEWPAYKKDLSQLVKGLGAEQFQRAYIRAYGPRGPLYGIITLLAAAVLTPPIMLVLTELYGIFIAEPTNGSGLASANLTNEVQRQFRRDGPLVYSFFLFFGLIASWGLIAFIVAHRFHKTRPGSLEDELRVARGEADHPDALLSRSRPKWSPLIQTQEGLKLPDQPKEE